MARTLLKLALSLSALVSLIQSSHSQTCSKYSFFNNRIFRSCIDLPVLNSFLHYNYDSSSGKIEIAYRRAGITSSTWVAWAINPNSTGMVGSQALVAYQQSDGSMRVYKSPLTQYRTQLQEGDLSFNVSGLSTTYSNNEIILFATLRLSNISITLNQVWQDGPLTGNNTPQMHGTSVANMKSMGTLNLLSGESRSKTQGGNSRLRAQYIHGLLNIMSWGIMMPIGVIFARHLKILRPEDGTWFYLHVTCQTTAYVVGVAGGILGLTLGVQSSSVQYDGHRAMGIVLLCLATLEAFALLLRPNPEHNLRFYWNIYHSLVGYAVIAVGIINVFKGFHILKPEKKWEHAYTGFLLVLASYFVMVEAYRKFVVLNRMARVLMLVVVLIRLSGKRPVRVYQEPA